MKVYDFTLKFSLPDTVLDSDDLVEHLGATGCDDALVGIGKAGRLALNFTRASSSAFGAISSAVADVRQAIPEAKLIEATPDLVGLTDVAEIVGCSRQNIRKIMLASGTDFPVPVHEGKSVLWHLSKVLIWLRDSKAYDIEDSLLDIVSTNMQFNMARDIVEVDPRRNKEILALVG